MLTPRGDGVGDMEVIIAFFRVVIMVLYSEVVTFEKISSKRNPETNKLNSKLEELIDFG